MTFQRIIKSKAFRQLSPVAAGILALTDGTSLLFGNDAKGCDNTPNMNASHRIFAKFGISQNSTQLDYYEHDPEEFDYYVKNPTVDDLPVLLEKFEQEGQEVWPWVWTHRNENGPHYVFVGVNAEAVRQIQELRRQSPQNNILVVADEPTLRQAASDAGVETGVYNECHCGIVSDAQLQLLHIKSKIIMLDDERVIAFDHLTIC